MERVGYARVSSVGQSLDVQRTKLADCDRIYEEKRSGVGGRQPQLDSGLEYVREGDVFVVTRLDRLARSTLHLCQIAATLERKGVALEVLDQRIDTGTSAGRLYYHMLAAVAQFETEIRAERQRDGIERARARGTHFGRRPALVERTIAELVAQRARGASIGVLAHQHRVSKATVYRYLAASQG